MVSGMESGPVASVAVPNVPCPPGTVKRTVNGVTKCMCEYYDGGRKRPGGFTGGPFLGGSDPGPFTGDQGGGASGTGGTYNSDRGGSISIIPHDDPNAWIKDGLIFDHERCNTTGTSSEPSYCCKDYERQQIIDAIGFLLNDPRVKQVPGLAECIKEAIESKKLKIHCPDNPPYEDLFSSEHREYIRKAQDEGVLEVPRGLTDSMEFVLAPFVHRCASKTTIDRGFNAVVDTRAILGYPLLEDDIKSICDYVKSHFPPDEWPPSWILGTYFSYNPTTGEVRPTVRDERGRKIDPNTDGPPVNQWGPCPE